MLIRKEEYVLRYVKFYVNHKLSEGEMINPKIIKGLIEQHEFDYDMDLEYRPEVLKSYY